MAIDLLSIQPNVISRDLRSKYVLLSGAPKIGKTEFCTQAPDALVLAFEIGTNARPGAMVQPVTKWSDFKLILRQLEKQEVKDKFSTICIDTIGICYDLCEQFVCAQNGVTKIGDIPYGGGYSQLSKEFENSLRKITMLGYGLIMTSHLKETYDEEGNLISAKPDLNNRCLKIVNGLVDIIAVITQEWDKEGNSVRWVQTRSTPTVTAGTRFRFMKPKIPFGYTEFVNALAEAIDKESENGAIVVDKKETNYTETLDFNEIYSEAKNIWTTIINRAETDEEKERAVREMSKKVELIFGKKIKLSEVTEDQVDLLNLAVLDLKTML